MASWTLISCVKSKWESLSRVRLFVTPWTVAHQAPVSIGFSRQEYWSGWPFPSPGDLPDPGIEPPCRQTLYCLCRQRSTFLISGAFMRFSEDGTTFRSFCLWHEAPTRLSVPSVLLVPAGISEISPGILHLPV